MGDSTRSRTTPWMTRLIILGNVIAFVYILSLSATPPANDRQATREFIAQTRGECYGFETAPTEADRFLCTWAFQPKEFFDTVAGDSGIAGKDRWIALAAVVTSMFLHGGWLHIIGNMLFLWVFGDNIEDRLGHWAYLAFFLLAGIAAAFIQGAMDTASVTPVLGASGGVAGVLGAYLFWFPKATVKVVIPFFILIFIPLPVPAWVMIGLWFAQNLLNGYATIADAAAPDQGVAWFAHIGGFAFGMLVAWMVGRVPRGRRGYG